MAFSGAEKAALSEIAVEEKSVTDAKAALVDTDAETLLKAYIVTWNLKKNSVTVKMKGGGEGIDYDVKRLLVEITGRVRKLLGLPLVSDEMLALDPNAMSIFEIEVGSNFA